MSGLCQDHYVQVHAYITLNTIVWFCYCQRWRECNNTLSLLPYASWKGWAGALSTNPVTDQRITEERVRANLTVFRIYLYSFVHIVTPSQKIICFYFYLKFSLHWKTSENHVKWPLQYKASSLGFENSLLARVPSINNKWKVFSKEVLKNNRRSKIK